MQQVEPKATVQTTTSYIDVTAYRRLLERRSAWVIAAFSILLFFALSVIVDSRRLLWYDEISTLALVRLPSMAAIWHAMHEPIDGSTPTYFFLEKIFYSGFHQTALAARLLSSVAVSAGLVIIFDCTRRLAGGLYGLLAAGAVMCSFVPHYSYEARAYALEFFFSAAALWIWLHVDSRSWRQPVLFGTCFLLGELGHYYFVFCLVPYYAFELLNWRAGQRRIASLIAAFTGCIAALVILLPSVLATRELSKHFWAAVTIADVNSFSRFFPRAMVPLCLCAVWLAVISFARTTPRANSEPVRRVPAMTSAEQLGWLFVLIPIAGIVAGRLFTHAFVERYFITFIPGVALAVGCMCSRLFRSALIPALGVVAIVLLSGLGDQARSAVSPDTVESGPSHDQQALTQGAIDMEPKILKDGKKFVVVPDSVLFLESRFYSHAPERYPFVPQLSLSIKDYTNALTLTNMSPIAGFPLWTIADIEKNAADTALVKPGEGLIRQLHRHGFVVTVKSVDPIPVFYIEKQ